jgi:hypothetical protein
MIFRWKTLPGPRVKSSVISTVDIEVVVAVA